MKYSVTRKGKWKEQCHDIPSFPDIRSLIRMREWSHEKEREREKKKSAEMVFPILKYTNRWDGLTRFDTLTTGNVAAFISRVSPCLLFTVSLPTSTTALLIHYENFSKTNEWISCEFQEARHYRRWLRERNQFSSLVRFLFCATRYMTLYRELPIAAEIRWNSADATSTTSPFSSLLFSSRENFFPYSFRGPPFYRYTRIARRTRNNTTL